MSTRSTELADETSSPLDIPDSSKREYLLAQIRQKDAIIESLLKQVSVLSPRAWLCNPSRYSYLATQPVLGDTAVYCVLSHGYVAVRPEQPERARMA